MLKELSLNVDFWNKPNVKEVMQEISDIEQKLEEYYSIDQKFQDLETIVEMLKDTDDSELENEFQLSFKEIAKQISLTYSNNLLCNEYDTSDAIVTIHSGAGGTEAEDWTSMLYRMYLRYAERHSFKTTLLDALEGGEAGYKSITFQVSGKYAYGYLSCEQGVHRLVRISPFDAAKKRHTSFASVAVLPVLPEDAQINIRSEDLKLDTFRASGAGGQYVNMTDSAVRITHIPTGIIVSCQTQRSQHQNRAFAMSVLASKLYELERQERQKELDKLAGWKQKIEWGSQIRSYTLQPFQLVKDHRTKFEIGNANAVLNGEIDDFITQYLVLKKKLNIQ